MEENWISSLLKHFIQNKHNISAYILKLTSLIPSFNDPYHRWVAFYNPKVFPLLSTAGRVAPARLSPLHPSGSRASPSSSSSMAQPLVKKDDDQEDEGRSITLEIIISYQRSFSPPMIFLRRSASFKC